MNHIYSEPKDVTRAALKQAMAAYIKSGGKIQIIPSKKIRGKRNAS